MGLLSGVTSTAGDAYGAVAGVADDAAGSTDEAVGRTFDNEAGGGVVDGTVETTTGVGTAVLDVPADAVNATLGTGENLGWFGVIDRKMDPRSWGSGPDPDWADPSDATTGISGFFRGATGAAGGLARQPILLVLLGLGALLAVGPALLTALTTAGGSSD